MYILFFSKHWLDGFYENYFLYVHRGNKNSNKYIKQDKCIYLFLFLFLNQVKIKSYTTPLDLTWTKHFKDVFCFGIKNNTYLCVIQIRNTWNNDYKEAVYNFLITLLYLYIYILTNKLTGKIRVKKKLNISVQTTI
jgi:hypothetical protein